MLRHIGLFHPGILKRGSFILFYTANPKNHDRALGNWHRILLDKDEAVDAVAEFPQFFRYHVSYSAAQFSNYKEVHHKIHKYLNKLNSEDDVRIYSDKIFWPIVTIPDNMLHDEGNLKSWHVLLENALKE